MRIAIIDLGTNTCNLLIAEILPESYSILHQSKQLVKLGDNKIKANEISNNATRRTVEAFRAHNKIIQKYSAKKVKVIATSAVRQAGNKISFLEKIGEETGWAVKVITGEKEAGLIFNGVLLAIDNFEKPTLILDIGGGSNELILAHRKEIIWKESQPTGMARVVNQFPISDPITIAEIDKIQDFFARNHKSGYQKSIARNVQTLVGCSGAFDTIADLIDGVNPGEKQRTTQTISIEDFNRVHATLIRSSRQQRLQMKGMDFVRIDLIVPAVIFIEQIISEIGIKQIIQTDFALSEGILSETIEKGTRIS